MRAEVQFTQADAERGYSETLKALRTYSDAELMREYLDGMRASFNEIFGHNARKFNKLVAQVLIERNITEIPNIFGAIEVTQ